MEQFTVILVVLFCFFFIGCPVMGALTARRRRRQVNAANPGPKELYRARRTLSTVTTFSSVKAAGAGLGGSIGDADAGAGAAPRRGSWWWVLQGSENQQKKSRQEYEHEMQDTEANAAQLDLGECPICIGPLVPEPAYVEDTRNAREILDGVTTVTTSPPAAATNVTPTGTDKDPEAGRSNADTGPGEGSEATTTANRDSLTAALFSPMRRLREGYNNNNNNHNKTATTNQATRQENSHAENTINGDTGHVNPDQDRIAPTNLQGDEEAGRPTDADQTQPRRWWAKYKHERNERAVATYKAGEDDILSLNTCRHAFHAKCLASWFLIDRYDCPICRTVYYVKPPPSRAERFLNAALPAEPVALTPPRPARRSRRVAPP